MGYGGNHSKSDVENLTGGDLRIICLVSFGRHCVLAIGSGRVAARVLPSSSIFVPMIGLYGLFISAWSKSQSDGFVNLPGFIPRARSSQSDRPFKVEAGILSARLRPAIGALLKVVAKSLCEIAGPGRIVVEITRGSSSA